MKMLTEDIKVKQGGHKPGKHGNLKNSGNLKNCQNLRENSGKFKLLQKKTWKTQENEKYVT